MELNVLSRRVSNDPIGLLRVNSHLGTNKIEQIPEQFGGVSDVRPRVVHRSVSKRHEFDVFRYVRAVTAAPPVMFGPLLAPQ